MTFTWPQRSLEGRFLCFTGSVLVVTGLGPVLWFAPNHAGLILLAFIPAVLLTITGAYDVTQRKHAILRNYPIIGHLRFLLESIRPELRQYFFEGENDGMPFSRSQRAIVYQRAKRALDTKPFGTQIDVYAEGHEWMMHSIAPAQRTGEPFRITIGGPSCSLPYDCSLLNISAMSYGALSANAIRALNQGAFIGKFAHDSGEGGVSPYHLEAGGDLIWEIGSGYFGCRNVDGEFSPEKFSAMATNPQVKMIEIKISQGAKPGHGGVLPAPKVTEEIAVIRGVRQGQECVSPAKHSAFSSPEELLNFVSRLRDLSGGKPTGFKLCIGHKGEFLGILKAMIEAEILPDFIVVDGNEGGTGAAPAEFVDNLGLPLREGLNFVHSALIAAGLRDKVKLGCAGKIITGFDMACVLALGADWCNVARGFMFALGCVQAQSCHTGRCPTGIATQDLSRQRAIDVTSKADRVAHFHRETINSLAELLAAAGTTSPRQLLPGHISRRVSDGKIMTFAELYPTMQSRAFLTATAPKDMQEMWDKVSGKTFEWSAG